MHTKLADAAPSAASSSTPAAPLPAPGRATLTHRASLQLRRRGVEPAPTATAEAPAPSDEPEQAILIAHEGVAGAGETLPHLDTIQRAFGRHDVGGIRAHVGGAAADAAGALGAEAYATGDAVAFRDAPDLHVVAHEAAHVVQQRAGVSLYGGVGVAGDPYERHADQVADAVVRGESAEALLDAMPSGGGATTAVQRKEEASGELPKREAQVDLKGVGSVAFDPTGGASYKKKLFDRNPKKDFPFMVGPVPGYFRIGAEFSVEASRTAKATDQTAAGEDRVGSMECRIEGTVAGLVELGAGEADLFAVFGQGKLSGKVSGSGKTFGNGDFEGTAEASIVAEVTAGIRALKIKDLEALGIEGFEFKATIAEVELLKVTFTSPDISTWIFQEGAGLTQIKEELNKQWEAQVEKGARRLAELGEYLGLENPYQRREEIRAEIEDLNEFATWWEHHRAPLVKVRELDPQGRYFTVEQHNAILAAYRQWWNLRDSFDSVSEALWERACEIEQRSVGDARALVQQAQAKLGTGSAAPGAAAPKR